MKNLKGSNLTSLKRKNKSKIIQTIYEHGPISRAEIAQITKLTPPTITTNIASLMADNLVEELSDTVSTNNTSLGRRPILIDLVPHAGYVIGVEWAYRGISLYLSDLIGNCIESVSVDYFTNNVDEVIEIVHKNIDPLIEKSGIDRKLILGIGMGIPGFINADENIAVHILHNNMDNVDISSKLSKLTGFRVYIDNNVRAMAIAEKLFSKKPRPDLFAYFFISGGIACSFMINNKPIRGGLSGAGEIGHTVIEPNGPLCSCGNYGCLETLVSIPAIQKRVINILKNNSNTMLHEFVEDPKEPKISELVNSAMCGDNISRILVSDVIRYIGISIANMVNLINPKLIILDGEIFDTEYVQTKLVSIIKSNLFSINAEQIEFEFKPYDKMSGAIGGAAVAIKNFIIEQW